MSIPPRPYTGVGPRGPTFYPRSTGPVPGAVGGGNLNGLIGGIAAPLLCLGCLATMAILGLFGTMIGAAAYMNGVQSQYRKQLQGAGTTVEMNIMVLFAALLCSIYVLAKNRRGAVSS